jgi:hypothetical protein
MKFLEQKPKKGEKVRDVGYVPTFYLPVNLDLKTLLINNGRKEKFIFHYLFIISSIHYIRVTNKVYQKNDCINLNFETIIKVISERKGRQFLKDLKSWGIIESDGRYSKLQHKSIGYRLTEQYRGKTKQVQVTDKLIIKKLIKHREQQEADLKKLMPQQQELVFWLKELEIDYKGANLYVKKNYPASTEEYSTRIHAIDLIKRKEFFYIFDKFGNRFHSNLTNLASDLRPFLSHNGNRLKFTDIKNSQPLFFYCLMKYSSSISADEKEKYRNLVETGTFYEFFMKKFGVPDESRDEFKKKIFSCVLFDRNRQRLSKYEVGFQEEFPQFFEQIRNIKEHDYTKLSQNLQRMESKFIILSCVDAFSKKVHHSRFVNTVHDCLVIEQCDEITATEVMLTCFKQIFNSTPMIEITDGTKIIKKEGKFTKTAQLFIDGLYGIGYVNKNILFKENLSISFKYGTTND